MPARSTRVYVVRQNARQTGLAFAIPSWWDIERIFQANAHRRIVLPDSKEVLLLDWPSLLGFDVKEGKKTWDVPERQGENHEIEEQKDILLAKVQDAEWFIIERDRAWIVPEGPRPGCDVFEGPPWWSTAFMVPEYRSWYQSFCERRRLNDRRFELPNPLWMDYVQLLTRSEALLLDEHSREAHKTWRKRIGRRRTAYERRQMARFSDSLQQAEWIILYDYEWESGLN